MTNHDESDLVYDDTRYFSRGREGYRPDPARDPIFKGVGRVLYAVTAVLVVAVIVVQVYLATR